MAAEFGLSFVLVPLLELEPLQALTQSSQGNSVSCQHSHLIEVALQSHLVGLLMEKNLLEPHHKCRQRGIMHWAWGWGTIHAGDSGWLWGVQGGLKKNYPIQVNVMASNCPHSSSNKALLRILHFTVLFSAICKPSSDKPEFIGGTDAEAEAPILWPPDAKNWLVGKDPVAGKDWRQEEKGTTEDEMVRWHHRLKGHEFEQAPGVDKGQGSLVYCSPWGCKESNMIERMNWLTENMHSKVNLNQIDTVILGHKRELDLASNSKYITNYPLSLSVAGRWAPLGVLIITYDEKSL